MTHEQSRENLSAWLDGALAGPAADAVARHVASCHDCRAEADAIRALSASLRALPRHQLPADLRTRLADPAVAAPARGWLPGPWALAASAAVACILVVGVIGLRRTGTTQVAQLETKREAAGLAKRKAAVPEDLGESVPQRSDSRVADRFVPTPPAPPDDGPSAPRDGDAAAVPGAGASAQPPRDAQEPRAAKELRAAEELQALGARDDAVGAFAPVPPTAGPGGSHSAAVIVESPAKPRENPLTYVARLTADENGAWRLEQLTEQANEPRAANEQSDSEEPGAKTSGSVATKSEPASGAPAMARAQENAPATASASPSQKKEDEGLDTRAQIMFLVQLDADGTITSAQLVGARTTAPEIVEAARSLLIGTRFPATAVGRLSHATVRVLVPPPRP